MMTELVGDLVEVVSGDGAARPERTVALWNPTLLDPETGERASALAEAAAMIAELVARDLRVICFGRSRRMVEVVHRVAREIIAVRGAAPARRDRPVPGRLHGRAAPRARAAPVGGRAAGVVATNALELGIDIGMLDCAISIGFPGTVASLRQQWGRAGRSGAGLAVLVASADALDQYFIRHPAMLTGRPVEAAILDHASPEIRRLHLACAAYEGPITEADDAILGGGAYAEALRMAEQGDLRVTAAGVTWGRGEFPAGHVALRSSSGAIIAIVDTDTGQVLGTVEQERAYRTVHEGAIYLHLGESFLVSELDLGRARRPRAAVRRGVVHAGQELDDDRHHARPHVGGQPRRRPVVRRGDRHGAGARLPAARPAAARGDRHARARTAAEQFHTQALWFCVPDALLHGIDDVLGSLHAAEHALISVLPLHAMCDRWDIGGLSTNLHPGTGRPTIFVYDGHPGGIGITRRGYDDFAALVRDARDVIRDCPCTDGCPSCVQSPKCGNLNEPLSKHGALALMERMLGLGS